ncbi:hypothetical protein L9F63_024804, partial [Diploptera punctata]
LRIFGLVARLVVMLSRQSTIARFNSTGSVLKKHGGGRRASDEMGGVSAQGFN